MAAGVLLRQHVLPLAGLTSAVVLYPRRTSYAEEPQIIIRKPIYETETYTPPPEDSPERASHEETSKPAEEAGPRAPTPTDRLAAQIKKSRLFLHSYATRAEDSLNNGVSYLFSTEQSIADTITSLAPARETNEKVLPGAIYVLVAGLAGTIISRNRNILIRFVTPLTTSVVAAHYVLPHTTRNVEDLIWRYEERVPVVRDNHLRISQGVRDLMQVTRQKSEVGLKVAEEKVAGVRETVEDWVKKGR